MLHQILNGVPKPITDYCPELDLRLVQLVDQALEKDPDDRFQNIAAVQRELAGIRHNPQASVVDASAGRSRRARRRARSTATSTLTRAPIEEHLIAAQRAFESGDYDAAIESCKQVLLLNASEARAIALIDRMHAAIDDQQLRSLQQPAAGPGDRRGPGAGRWRRRRLSKARQEEKSDPQRRRRRPTAVRQG